jgi:hypothetical protein
MAAWYWLGLKSASLKWRARATALTAVSDVVSLCPAEEDPQHSALSTGFV